MGYWYIDRNGYEHSDLVHRQVAYHEIYLLNRNLYLLPFRHYQIHHRDGDKRNNAASNLQLVTREQHKRVHGIGIRSILGR